MLLLEGGIIDPLIEASPFQGIMDFTGSVGGDDDKGFVFR
jgi:hypothetical protein